MIRVVIPPETPNEIVDLLFMIAAVVGPGDGPMRWTLGGLSSAVIGLASVSDRESA